MRAGKRGGTGLRACWTVATGEGLERKERERGHSRTNAVAFARKGREKTLVA